VAIGNPHGGPTRGIEGDVNNVIVDPCESMEYYIMMRVMYYYLHEF
jgi:hypothetical protein